MGLFQLRAGPGLALAPAPAPARRVSCRAAAAVQQPPPAVRTVAIPYADLKERGKDLSASIEAGFGPDGLGIVSVSGVPSYPELRKQLLRLAPRVANLPDDVKKELEDVESRYHIGWSYGKERLESGEPDTLKGSFYANPIFDIPTANGVLVSSLSADMRRSFCFFGSASLRRDKRCSIVVLAMPGMSSGPQAKTSLLSRSILSIALCASVDSWAPKETVLSGVLSSKGIFRSSP